MPEYSAPTGGTGTISSGDIEEIIFQHHAGINAVICFGAAHMLAALGIAGEGGVRLRRRCYVLLDSHARAGHLFRVVVMRVEVGVYLEFRAEIAALRVQAPRRTSRPAAAAAAAAAPSPTPAAAVPSVVPPASTAIGSGVSGGRCCGRYCLRLGEPRSARPAASLWRKAAASLMREAVVASSSKGKPHPWCAKLCGPPATPLPCCAGLLKAPVA